MTDITADPGRDRPRSASPTLHDVARHAGVSLATASRVLNGSTRKVAESYGDRVRSSAELLGYSANLSAQATAKGTSAIIALLVADIADPYFGLLASGVAHGADEAGLVVTIAITERDAEREIRLVRALRGQRPRGLILAASRRAETTDPRLKHELDALTAGGGRIVTVGPGGGDFPAVLIDNRGGARALGVALAARGYRSAIVLGALEGVRTSDDRIEGFSEGFRSGGGDISRVIRGGFDREGGTSAMDEALAGGVAPGAVVFGISDVIALGAVSAIRKAGREVGADIAVAGFDDIPTGKDVTPALTTVHVPLTQVGHEALRAVLDDSWVSGETIILEVLLRESTPQR
ncbi:LacI family DNA-binding transcriptional regulator [Salinibacterium sp. G-O1]|uniref:LacI family DNA-binding transcriptional regulator n=1 Tax=Salinibacterium sp. G-O1 TaxID=3046208 RepID=UPI0024BBCAA7|nr:LacI family DNA-binding transcriptional regulator [Salinibacterium sp. G-O1]MDJ0334055.1 LacI family DNA-binding transcriptional regulator [Salinibacterium sp. G-O1]